METQFSPSEYPPIRRPTAPRRGIVAYLLPIAAILLLALLAALFFLRPRTSEAPAMQTATLTVLASAVETRPTSTGTWAPVTTTAILQVGAGVRTVGAGRAEVEFADGSVLRLNADTEIAIQMLPTAQLPSSSVELLVGEVWNRIVNLGERGTYQIDGGEALALVRGTAFSAKRSADRFGVAAVQHAVTVRHTRGASATVTETRRVDLSFSDPALDDATTLPTEPQDLAFLQSKWRRANLEADILHLERLARTRPELATEAREAATHSRCLLDVKDCEGGPDVQALRTSVVDNVATVFLELKAWDGRPLQLVWTRGGTVVRETTLRPQPGDLLAEDRLPITEKGDYTVEALLDRIALKSAQFTVEEVSAPPSEPASSTPPSTPGVCRSFDATATCGTKQYYLDRDKDCVYDACATCPTGRIGVDANKDGYAESCVAAPVSSIPPSSSPPPSSSQSTCQDPGTCTHGWDATACSCKSPPTPVCGNGTVESGESCEPPNTQTCSASCQKISAPVAACGNNVVEAGEQCDPPNNYSCSQQCQTFNPIYFCGNGTIEGAEQCDPPDGYSCDASCKIVQYQPPTYSSTPPPAAY